ncbi:MAG: alpha/beta family hydrolase [Hyphomicrobiaceae bacterium]
MTDFLTSGPDDADVTLLLAHGAGAPMDSAFMNIVADLMAERGLRTMRFEFPYMASRRRTGKRKPAPKAETLMPVFVAVAQEAAAASGGKLVIGGKSMGGRVASLVADQLRDSGVAQGLACLGYPFHPPGMPEKLRTRHLEALRCPALIVQGERDPFGARAEVEAYPLSKAIGLSWIGDGDHDLGPRGGSGFTRKGNLAAAADAVAAFSKAL